VRSGHPYLAEGPYPRALAHRGWHLGELAAMENSMSAFRRAVEEGYRYIETDVQATTDGVVVVQHDDVLDRTTDRQGVIAKLPWSEVGRAKVGGREEIPTLEAVLEELPTALLNVDVKADNAAGPVLRVLERCNAWDRVCLASFSDARLARLRKVAGPKLVTSMGPGTAGALWAAGRWPWLGTARFVRGQMAQVPIQQGPLRVVDHRFVAGAHRLGLEVHVWTVDEEPAMRELLDFGVDGIVTDRPDVLRDVLKSRGSWAA
jgi:glycerophosphoryl diester phosphodiesterase